MLQIQPKPSAQLPIQRFSLTGNIDIDAIPILETLYVLPSECVVELDFALVQRVNSMGLAQLLKLFEHWQKLSINIRVVNLNRMIDVLFKMTGLHQFTNGSAKSVSHSPPISQTPPSVESQTPQQPTLKSVKNTPVSTPSSKHNKAKVNLWVNAQSNQQLNGWYFFNTYLQRHLGCEVHLELVNGAINDQKRKIEEMDIAFTTPFQATRLIIEYDYQPLLHPTNQTDEVTLLVRAEDTRQKITDFGAGKVITASADNFVYLLGRFLLEESTTADFQYIFSGNEIKALQILLKSQADILLMASKSYQGLSSLTRNMLRKIDQSDTGFAFYLFCVAPHNEELGCAITEVLLNMGQDSQGRKVLADLDLEGWSRPKRDEINMLVNLFNRYAVEAKPRATAANLGVHC